MLRHFRRHTKAPSEGSPLHTSIHEAWHRLRTVNPAIAVPCAAVFALAVGTLVPYLSSSPDAQAGAPQLTARTPAPAPWWTPTGTARWHVQYTGDMTYPSSATVFNLDAFDTSAATVKQLQARGAKVMCYFNAGAAEDWRSDYRTFPPAVMGRAMDGWAGERWLDIRRLDVVAPIMNARVQMCKSKGFDAVDPDNMDSYQQNTGFSISYWDQIEYHRALVVMAHRSGLAIGLKNDVEQIKHVEPWMDFAVNESCEQYDECHQYRPFLDAGKPVFHISYDTSSRDSVCASVPQGFSTIFKNEELTGWATTC